METFSYSTNVNGPNSQRTAKECEKWKNVGMEEKCTREREKGNNNGVSPFTLIVTITFQLSCLGS